MKKTIYGILFALLALTSACSDFTDIDPKGKNVLSRVDDLDMLLNYEYRAAGIRHPHGDADGQRHPAYTTNIPNILSAKEKTLTGVLATWDETADRALLTATDETYSECYSINARVANAVIGKIDAAEGDRYKAQAAQSRGLRPAGLYALHRGEPLCKSLRPRDGGRHPGRFPT